MPQDFNVRGGEPTGVWEELQHGLQIGMFSTVEFDPTPADTCADIFAEYTGVPFFDNALNSPDDEAVAEACVTPVDWLRLQMASAESSSGERADHRNWLSQPIYRAENTRELVSLYESREQTVPKPVLELDRDANITGYQEGRNRGVAAYYADVERMPVWFLLDPTNTRGSGILQPPSARKVRQYLDANRAEVFPDG